MSLGAVIQEVWAAPMLRDMPPDTVIETYSTAHDRMPTAVVRTRDCTTCYAPSERDLRGSNAECVAHLDRGLAELRRQHWHHMAVLHSLAGYGGWR